MNPTYDYLAPNIVHQIWKRKNFNNWLSSCKVDNVTASRDELTMKILTKLSIENLMHPFQTFILGQKIFAAKVALKYKIPLVFLVRMKQSMEIQ